MEGALAAVLEALPAETSGVPALAPRVFSWGLERLDEEALPSLRADDPLVLEARAALDGMLRASLERPQQLLEVFGAFAELGAISIPEHLAAVEARGCDLAAYADEIAKWRQTAERVRAAAPSEVHCRMLLVHCAALQAELEAKAHELAAGVAELVVAELAAASRRVSDSYAGIFERLQQASSSAEEVSAMQAFLESCEEQLQQLQAAIDHELFGRLELLSDVQHALEGEVFSDVYATAAWPVRLQQVVDDAERQLEEDRMTFQQQLRDDQVRLRLRVRVRLRLRVRVRVRARARCLTLP